MSLKFIYCHVSLMIILDLPVNSYLTSNTNPFYSASEDVRFLVENLAVPIHKEFSDAAELTLKNIIEDPIYGTRILLKFHPPSLDFEERSLGIPHHEKVTVINTSCNRSVHMSSISGNTVHFHSSFFQDKIVPPLGNTTFNIVFLGREEGEIESYLFIHTSEGSFKYLVRGESIISPYRLRPISGVRLPLNASYSPLIIMHNPYSTPLQLVEIYSSGSDFHLELPTGELEGPKHIWNIPAFLTKPIIRLKFHASSQKNHTAYIRLKLDNSGEILVVPVDVEVGPAYGLYSSDDLIDFGIGGTDDPPKQYKLYLKNSWRKPIKVHNVISTPVSRALSIDFHPVKIYPHDPTPTEVAVLKFDWKVAHETGFTNGKIVIKSNHSGQKFIMTYIATVLDGGLHYDANEVTFRTDEPSIQPRFISILNNYKIPIALTNFSLGQEAEPYFEISDFESGVIAPGENRTIIILNIKEDELPTGLKLHSLLNVYSNVSVLEIPILCYDGRLKKVIPFETNIDALSLGTVGIGSVQTVHFALYNENPVAVQVKSASVNITGASVHAVAIGKGDLSGADMSVPSGGRNVTLNEPYIGPGHYCLMEVMVPVGDEVGIFYGSVRLETEYEEMFISLIMAVEHGSLNIINNPIEFEDCFPGAVCVAEVIAESYFTVPMATTSVTSIPHQSRFGFIPASPPLIPPVSDAFLGYITWDMSEDHSYLSPYNSLPGAQKWLETLSLPNNIKEWDINLLNRRYQQFRNISSECIEIVLRLDTTEVRNVGFKAVIRPSWPSIVPVPERMINFPLTQIGNISYQELTVTNPASKQPLIVQLLLQSSYPLSQGLLNDLPLSLRPPYNVSYDSLPEEGAFDLLVKKDLILPKGTKPHLKTVAFVLNPLSNTTVKIAFRPERADITTSILLIRNNLTILEAIQFVGAGAYTQFKFGHRKPGSLTPLVFEVELEKCHACERDITGVHVSSPDLTVIRSFTARNTGALPITIHGFIINGFPCQGYGFRVLNCHPFYLPPNTSRKIDIAFTSDLTLARVTRTLTIMTSDSPANYTLLAKVPSYLFDKCYSAIGRPSWEPIIYYISIIFLTFLLVCVIAAAIFESNRILRNTIIAVFRDQTVQPVLDLRAVGAEAKNSSMTVKLGISKTNSTPAEQDSPSRRSSSSNNTPEEASRESHKMLENHFQNGKIHSSTSTLTNRKKSEKQVLKRSEDAPESTVEKKESETLKANPSQSTKGSKLSGLCITTEPYTPLTLKPKEIKAESSGKANKQTSPKVNDSQQKKKKKVEEVKKVAVKENNVANLTEDVDSTSDTSSSDDGDKEVESTFFRSVRYNLLNKTAKKRPTKIQQPIPLARKPKKPLDKAISNSTENGWDADDDDPLDKGIVVKNNRRLQSKQLRKQQQPLNNLVKPRNENLPPKNKQIHGEKNKLGPRRDKGHGVKKRNEKTDKASTKIIHEMVPPPPPPVWTTSFSDVVASTYSSVVALKGNQQNASHKHPQVNSREGPSYPNNVKEYAPTWNNVNHASGMDSSKIHHHHHHHHHQNNNATGPMNISGSSVWDNWSTFADTLNNSCTLEQASANSFFTNNPPRIAGNGYNNIWNDPNVMQAMQHQPVAEYQAANQYANNDVNWPVVPSVWEPIYTPTIAVESPRPVWGSDVWGPPAQPSPSVHEEVKPQPPIPLEYDPFRSLSNIWSQHSTNIWKPPKSD